MNSVERTNKVLVQLQTSCVPFELCHLRIKTIAENSIFLGCETRKATFAVLTKKKTLPRINNIYLLK